jgi:oligopeptide transport system substrate-binding protein
MGLPSYPFSAKLFHLAASLLITVVAVASTSCESHAPGNKQGSDSAPLVLRRGLGGQPGSLDPQRAEDAFSFDVLRDLYEGLTTSSPSGEVLPAVAESWSVDEVGTHYSFKLRRDARWSNGDPVLAQHFVTALRRAVDPATASGGADLLRAIQNAPAILKGEMPADKLAVRAADDHLLEITLSQPVAYFPDILTNTIASPVHDSSLVGAGGFSKGGATVSNGPYSLAEVVPGASLRLVRNPYYRDSGAVTFDEVRYELVPDENAEFTRFRAGELDVTNNVPEQRFEELARVPKSGLQHRAALATFYFSFNTDRGTLSERPALREALSLAIDREAITTSITRAGQLPAYSLVPEGVWNYTPAIYEWQSSAVAARLSRARALYAAAGHSAAKPLRLRMLYNENDLIQKVCVAIASMWKQELGVETELVQMEFRAYLAARADPTQWDVVRVGWSADYNDASSFLDTMTAGSPQNFGRWSNAQYARLLAGAAAETDIARRRQLLQQAERLMLEDYPLLPVYFYVTRRLVQPRISAPPINPMNRTYSRDFGVTE